LRQTVLLQAGRWNAAVDAWFVQLASSRCPLQSFATEEGVAVSATLRRGPLEAPVPLDSAHPELGHFQVVGDEVRVDAPEGVVPAELALRQLYQLAVLRQGGVLLHGAGIAFEGHVVLALGRSGAGKSTLSRLCAEQGAQILSDETVALYPDGVVHGTPFRSELDLGARPELFPLLGLLMLEHGSEEQLSPLEPASAVQAVLAQTYRCAWGEVGSAELLRRVTAAQAKVPMMRFRFRKDAQAAAQIRSWMGVSWR
jgi:hypothetical protein